MTIDYLLLALLSAASPREREPDAELAECVVRTAREVAAMTFEPLPAVADRAVGYCAPPEPQGPSPIFTGGERRPRPAPALLDRLRSRALHTAERTRATVPVTSPVPVRNVDLTSLFTDDDYPFTALRLRQEGDVGVELAVDGYGRVVRCKIVRSSGVPALNATTCGVLRRRARFSPARAANGTAMTGVATFTKRWALPRQN